MTGAPAWGGGGKSRRCCPPHRKKMFSILCGGLFPPYGGGGPFSLCGFFSSHRDFFSMWVACFLLLGGLFGLLHLMKISAGAHGPLCICDSFDTQCQEF